MCFDQWLRPGVRFLRWPTTTVIALSASAALACSTIVLGLPDRPVVAYSFDFDATGAGSLFVNPERAMRRSIMDGTPAEWDVHHGSVTFNQIGPGMPAVGMNTAGLVVSLMWNNEAVYGGAGNAPVLNELEFIQLLLDTAGSVDAALETLRDVQIQGMVPIHYLLADRFGSTAVVTPTSTGLMVHAGKDMPFPALTNTSYPELVDKVADFEGFGGKSTFPFRDRLEDLTSLERFAVAANASRRAGSALTTDWAFDVLDDVANSESRWQIVFDPTAQKIAFRIVGQKGIHLIDLQKMDFRCFDRPLSVELGDLSGRQLPGALTPVDPVRTGNIASEVLGSFSGAVGFGPEIAHGLIQGLLESVTCDP